ncbi:DUF3087 family protein [Psychromonas sp. KJ10-10]
MLDDNLLTISQLDKSQQELDELLLKYQIKLDITEYDSSLLKGF